MSQLFTWGGQSIGVSASASVLPMNTQDWSPLGWRTGWLSLQSKGLSRVFNTTVQKHQFFSAQLSSQSNSHIHKSLVASKWIIFLFKSRNILCFWPLPNSVTMSQWLLSFSFCIYKITILCLHQHTVMMINWGITEEQNPWRIVIAQQSWVTVVIICLNITVIIFATPLPRPTLNTSETQKCTLTSLKAAFLLRISLHIFKSI